MKRLVPIFFILFFIFLACEKKEKNNSNSDVLQNAAVPICTDSKQILGYKISVMVGHSSNGCPGCVTMGGNHFHVPCQGAGSSCAQSATIYLYQDDYGTDLYFAISVDELDLTDEDFFLMPDRSLYIVGANGEFLNIPEQMLYRDEDTGTFIFYDIFFSDYQAFVNK